MIQEWEFAKLSAALLNDQKTGQYSKINMPIFWSFKSAEDEEGKTDSRIGFGITYFMPSISFN